MDTIEPVIIRQKTIVRQVMEQIKDLVASGNIKPGDKIPTELEMAKIFGVSRSSIREAIKIFSYLGVFETQTRRGTVLCTTSSITDEALTWTFLLGPKEIDDLMELRKAIEQDCWMRLCKTCAENPQELEHIRKDLQIELDGMSAALGERDLDRLTEADFRFHQKVIAHSGNVQFIHLFGTLKSFTRDAIRTSNVKRALTSEIVDEHLKILQELESGHGPEVLRLFNDHIENSKARILASGKGSPLAVSLISLK